MLDREQIYINMQFDKIGENIKDNAYRLQIVSICDKTHYLNITQEQLKQIKQILLRG